MEVSLGRLEVNVVSSEKPLAHPTEEFTLVLEGVMDVEIGPLRYVLEPRDAIYYPGVTPHRFVSVGHEDLIYKGHAELGACRIGDDFHELRALPMGAVAVIYSQGRRFRASNPFAGGANPEEHRETAGRSAGEGSY
jgi:hypothetical protein